MSLIVGALDATWPVACHMPSGGLAPRTLTEARRARDDVVDDRRRVCSSTADGTDEGEAGVGEDGDGGVGSNGEPGSGCDDGAIFSTSRTGSTGTLQPGQVQCGWPLGV